MRAFGWTPGGEKTQGWGDQATDISTSFGKHTRVSCLSHFCSPHKVRFHHGMRAPMGHGGAANEPTRPGIAYGSKPYGIPSQDAKNPTPSGGHTSVASLAQLNKTRLNGDTKRRARAKRGRQRQSNSNKAVEFFRSNWSGQSPRSLRQR